MKRWVVAVCVVWTVMLATVPFARAETLVRWTIDRVPSPDALGIRTIVVPLERPEVIDAAARMGYLVLVEVDAEALATTAVPAAARGGVIVRGPLTDEQRRAIGAALPDPAARILTLEHGVWPHVRLNAVSSNKGVLQVAGRTSQPWLEHNGALVAIAGLRQEPTSLLTYEWVPLTVADEDAGPGTEQYLVAIADAGSTGASLLLPLHERLQEALLQGHPEARRTWSAIRDAMAFYAWELPRRYTRVADVTVVAADPMAAMSALDMLGRHNIAFDLAAPEVLRADRLPDAVVVLDEPAPALADALATHEKAGHLVIRSDGPIVDPNVFAMDVRNRLGRDRRTLDIWNGITVLVTAWRDAADGAMMLELVNYAGEPRPVQLRVRGTYAAAYLESPSQEAMLIPFTQRDGTAELVVPDLHVGTRVFLTPVPGTIKTAAVPPPQDR